MARLFPLFVKLENRAVLVVGAGGIGEPKIRSLLETGARITVVALQASAAVREWAEAGQLTLEKRAFSAADLDGMFLVIAAAGSREVNELVFSEARRRGVLCNVVDVPDQCDFFYPAVVRRGDLQIAISTGGQSPSLAQRLRKQLERQFGPGYEEWVAQLGEARREVLASSLDGERKRQLLQSLASREAFEAELASQSKPSTKERVW
jgi:precorrin-2 dehydrogenase/sirohydrochlorin ferrochelatase